MRSRPAPAARARVGPARVEQAHVGRALVAPARVRPPRRALAPRVPRVAGSPRQLAPRPPTLRPPTLRSPRVWRANGVRAAASARAALACSRPPGRRPASARQSWSSSPRPRRRPRYGLRSAPSADGWSATAGVRRRDGRRGSVMQRSCEGAKRAARNVRQRMSDSRTMTGRPSAVRRSPRATQSGGRGVERRRGPRRMRRIARGRFPEVGLDSCRRTKRRTSRRSGRGSASDPRRSEGRCSSAR